MEASRTTNRKWKWDDTKWIIALLITLVGLTTYNSATTRSLSKDVENTNIKVERVYQNYLPVEQFINIVDLLQTEKKELVGISRNDSVAVQEAMDKYHKLIAQWAKDLSGLRGTVINYSDKAWKQEN